MGIHEGRVAIVTGGGQGIGRCLVERFLKEDMRVVIAEFDEEAGQEAEREFSRSGHVKFIKCNVADEGAVKNMVGETVKNFGRIDVLINNAAISNNKHIEDLTLKEWERVIGVNLTGPFLCSKYCAPYLKQLGGAIVNMASTRAFMSEANTEAYSASKGGIFALTHALSISLGPEVRVNSISPGWIETGEWKKNSKRYTPSLSQIDHAQHPAGRVGIPQDIANMVIFLISPDNSFITGANFVVDGGMTRKMIYVE